MKQKLLFAGIILSFLFSCKNQVMQSEGIDVEYGLQNLTHLKTSDFGKTIRYIPLETTDDGLVGNNPTVKVLKNHIVIEFASPKSCLLFNKQDGSFIAAIGNVGQGPDEYSDVFSWTDEKEEFLYFGRQPDQLLKFDMQGNFRGRVKFSFSSGLASYYLLTDSEIIGYFGSGIFISQTIQFALGIFDNDGILNDTIPSLLPNLQLQAEQVGSVSVIRRNSTYGNWAKAGTIIIDFKNDTRQILAPNSAKLWRNNKNIRFKEDFVDTLYTLANNQLIPSIIFHTGKYHWPVEERTSKQSTNERIFIADVSENENFVFFQCIRGMYSDTPVLYNGLYHKQTGVTKLSKFSDAIADDLTHFMPFIPLGMSTTGEFVSLIEAGAIMEWLEKHPEAKNNEKLAFLKTLDEEMNPVVVLIE